jgi:hypothetical protein
MAAKAPAHFDPETITAMREVLDDAWGSLSPEMQVLMSKTVLAERILKSAAKGERDRDRLRDAALRIAACFDNKKSAGPRDPDTSS